MLSALNLVKREFRCILSLTGEVYLDGEERPLVEMDDGDVGLSVSSLSSFPFKILSPCRARMLADKQNDAEIWMIY